MIYKFAILPQKCGKCNKTIWLDKYIRLPRLIMIDSIHYEIKKIPYCPHCAEERKKIVCQGCFYEDGGRCKIKDDKLCEPLGRLRYTMGID